MSYAKLLFTIFILASIAQATPNSKSIPVGVTAPFTGDFASYGEQIRNGVELARSDLAKSGTILDVHYEDACLPSGALAAITKLITVDNIKGLAANFCVVAMPAMAPSIQKNHLPTFQAAGASDGILALGEYVFTTDLKVRTDARKLAEYAAHKLQAKTASILNIETDFGEDYRKHFKTRFEELGGRVLSSAPTPIGVNDFRADLTLIKSKQPDVIFAAHLGLTLGVLLKQARQLGLRQQFLGTYEAGDASVIEVAGESANGLKFLVPEPLQITPAIQKFAADFKERHGRLPNLLEANSYDSTTLLGNALRECKGAGDCVKRLFEQQRVYDGVSGHFSMLGSNESQRHFVLKQVVDGKIVYTEP